MLNVKQKHLISFIKARSNIFKHETNTYYRECYPEAKEKEFMLKNKAKGEKTLSTIKLIDPDFDAQTLWRVDDDDNQGDDKGFIDISNQKANKPLVYQVCEKIRESGKEGMSQNEIGNHFGLTRLNARAVLRKLQRTRGVKFYLQDVGRQRVSRCVTPISSSFDCLTIFLLSDSSLVMLRVMHSRTTLRKFKNCKSRLRKLLSLNP